MRRIVVASVVVLLTATAACIAPSDHDEAAQLDESSLRGLDTEEAAFLQLINDYRVSKGLGKLTATPLLNQVAYDHSLDMGQKAYFAHDDLAGNSPFTRMKNAGYRGGAMAENIAAGNATGAATFTQWKNSPGHDANMLGTRYKAIGIGRANVAGSPYRWYWTTDFGDVIDSSATTPPPDAGTDTGATADAGIDTGATPPVSACTPEREPNDRYTAPNALGADGCGAVTAGGDQDWYTWSATTAGAAYDITLRPTGDAQILVWALINGAYQRMPNTSGTQVKGTTTAAGPFLVAVWSPSGTGQDYRIALTK
jgi:uncharacterized protein YkwD